ncbi:hypothetical protein DD238_001467 [Peronospora effusa]|uniref:Inward rectifier potassium channel C-terminal domain-containing protein n=1 Tax=Peronospora effusa TaxID=542832 RepID=A0A3M6VL42_9STRA|nr:hypothetical protein DD238_001467 [Peronospora effusa]
MEYGPSYSEYEDGGPLIGGNGATTSERVTIPTTTGRIMDRNDALFKRSKGQWNIRRHKAPHYWKLYMQDPFHTVVNMRLSKVLGSLVFATIITLESLCGILLDALAIGIIFQRFSRAQARANTIVMSTHACARRIRGDLYFMFQVCEMRKHQLVEAHVRMYAIRHDEEFGERYYFQSYPMRIQHPDDDLGGMLLLALPSVVVHRMDAWSPLLRPKSAETCGLHHNPARGYLFPEPLCRAADAQSGDRDGTVQVKQTTTSAHNACRCTNGTIDDVNATTPSSTIEEIKQYWAESQLEVVVLVEGIDAVTSATIQVRHSYRAEDIIFNHRHVNCVDVDPETGGAVIDFRRFHETKPVDPECNKVLKY